MEEAPSWRHTMLCSPQTGKDEAEVLQHRLRVEVVAVHVEHFELGGLRATQGLQELANLMGAFGGRGRGERGGEERGHQKEVFHSLCSQALAGRKVTTTVRISPPVC